MFDLNNVKQRNGEKQGRHDEGRGERGRRDDDRERRREREPRRQEAPQPRLSPEQARYRDVLAELNNTSRAKLLDDSGHVMKEVHVSKLAETLKEGSEGVKSVILDGIITQRVLDLAVEKNIMSVVGVKLGNIAKMPTNVEILTKEDLS
jgi:hypothetical protein